MLTVISPAKRLDFDSKLPRTVPAKKHSQPRLVADAVPLAEAMAKVGADGIAQMMSLSPQLGELNADRFSAWSAEHNQANARPALCAFDGDVYKGIDAASFTGHDFNRAQNRLRILSGLYGLLRPLDLIQPYRLEMGTSIGALGVGAATGAANGTAGKPVKSLPRYWQQTVTDLIISDLAQHTPSTHGSQVLVNLASPEYAAAVDTKKLRDDAGIRIVSPRFKDLVRGEYKVVGFFSKTARGAMAGWMLRNNVRSARALKDFDALGYRYEPAMSSADEPVFVRDAANPAAAASAA